MEFYPIGLLELGGESVVECETYEEAELCSHVLHLAEIRNVILRPSGKLDLRWPQVKVAPDDVLRAKEILSKPVDEKIRHDFEERPRLTDLPPLSCPHCASTDILLESADPANLWECEACGANWQDPEPEAPDE